MLLSHEKRVAVGCHPWLGVALSMPRKLYLGPGCHLSCWTQFSGSQNSLCCLFEIPVSSLLGASDS